MLILRIRDGISPFPLLPLLKIKILTKGESGVGQAMIKWGTDQADETRVYSWVSSSQGGATAFAKAGFEEIGHLTVNLNDYSDGVRNPETEDGKWGEYTFRTMKRPVKSL